MGKSKITVQIDSRYRTRGGGAHARVVAMVLVVAQVAVLCPNRAYGQEESRGVEIVQEETGEKITASAGGKVTLGDAEIEIPAGALKRDTEIKIQRLAVTRDTGELLANVTAGGGGYRFLPAGQRFEKAATIRIGYDGVVEGKPGVKAGMRSYYYDEKKGRWEGLELVEVDEPRRQVVSLTTHFTDMINGTLSMPEGPKPLSHNINSIKGLEAADPSFGVPGIEGLEGGSTGAAGFRLAVAVPAGRAGMTPSVAVVYSSDGGNGVMGKGFNLQAGGSVSTDTRWGVPRYNGKAWDGQEEDTYLLDGEKLRKKAGQRQTAQRIRYEAERETKNELIERVIREHGAACDYWEVTDKRGTRRTYGKAAWSGKDKEHKYTWELEKERDVYGNTVEYRYEAGDGRQYVAEIEYTGNEQQREAGAYTIRFNYETGRTDVRVDGRGGFVSKTDRLLVGIAVQYRGEEVRAYRMEYKANVFGAQQLEKYGEVRRDKAAEYEWSYGFAYEGFLGGQLFEREQPWGGIEKGLQVQMGITSGGQGSMSGGVGVGTSAVDVRLNGGGTYSESAGTTKTKETMIDLNGDGRPDSVQVTGNGIQVYRNTGDRFEEVMVSGMPGNIGKEQNWNTAAGWNLGAGLGLNDFGAQYVYAETNQNGWSDADAGFADIDGDGLIDIIVSGKDHYYHNLSGEGTVAFEWIALPTGAGARLPANVVMGVSETEKAALEDAFYQEAPLREWRAPETGTVRVEQWVQAAGGTVSGDGIAARTYVGEGKAAIETLWIDTDRREADNKREGQEIAGEQSLYFVADGGEDTRGDDIEWRVKISYERMRYYGDMDVGMRYVPAEGEQETTVEGNPLKALYDKRSKAGGALWYELSGRDWEEAFTDGDKAGKRAAWEEIVRRGWFVPGHIAGERFKALWDKAVERGEQEVLIRHYRYHAGDDAYVRVAQPEDEAGKQAWEAEEKRVNGMIREVQKKDGEYVRKLAGYSLYGGGEADVVYPVPNGKDAGKIYGAVSGSEALGGREAGKIGSMYAAGDGSVRLVIDVIDRKEWSVGANNAMAFTVTGTGNGSKASVTLAEPFADGPVVYYIDGEESGTAEVSKREGKLEVTIPLSVDGALQSEMVYLFSGFQWISETLTGEEMDSLRAAAQGKRYTIGHERWQGLLGYEAIEAVLGFCAGGGTGKGGDGALFFSLYTRIAPDNKADTVDAECSYRLRRDLSAGETEAANRILDLYGQQVFYTVDFPFYTRGGDGTFELKAEYRGVEVTKEGLERLFASNRGLFERYEQLVTRSVELTSARYRGELTREARYYAGGMYEIADGGITVWALEGDGNGKYGYVRRTVGKRRVQWDSGKDYTPEQRKPLSYTVLSSIADARAAGETAHFMEGMLDGIQDTKYEIEIGIAKVEALTGGVNRWYYGLWLGNQSRNPFGGGKLYEQWDKGGQDVDRKREEVERQQQAIKGGGEPKRDDAPKVYYQAAMRVAEAAAAEGRRDEELTDYGSGYTADGNTLLGRVSRTVSGEIGDDDRVIKKEETYFAYIRGNLLHTSRAGGHGYYQVPGVMPAADSGGGVMPDIRRSKSTGIDKTHTAKLSYSASISEQFSIPETLPDPDDLPASWSNILNPGNNSLEPIPSPGDTLPGSILTPGSTPGMGGLADADKRLLPWSYGSTGFLETLPYPGRPDSLPDNGIPWSELYPQSTPGYDIFDGLDTNLNPNSISLDFNYSTNSGDSQVYQSVQSISGSGIADILQTGKNGLTMVAGSRLGFSERYTISGITDIGRNHSAITAYGGALGADGTIKVQRNASGKPIGVGLNGGGSYAKGTNQQTSGFIDMNGDGLPDYADGGAIKMNLGRGSWKDSELGLFERHNLSDGDSKTMGISMPIGTVKVPDTADYTGQKADIGGVLNYSVSMAQTQSMLIDMNGDGLPDLVSADNSIFTVRYNLGDRFQSAQEAAAFNRAPDWTIGDQALLKFSTQTDGNILVGMFEDLPLVGHAVSTAVEGVLGTTRVTINPFGLTMRNYLGRLETNSSITVGLNASVSIGGSMSIPIPTTPVSLNLTLGGSGGITMNANLNGVTMRLMDIDGDGLPDRVLRIPGTDYLLVQRNLSGRVGLLRTIYIPQGGAYALDYQWEQSTTKMPQSRYVLSSVTTWENPAYRGQPAGEHQYTTRYEYEKGNYNRKEREFYGFEIVTARYADGSQQKTWYCNDEYYRHGMVKQHRRYDETGNVRQEALYDIDVYPYARVVQQETQRREAAGDGSAVRTKQVYAYDQYGNVTELEDYADGSASIIAKITYKHDFTGYLHAHPEQITVYEEGNGTSLLLRRREGFYDAKGALVRLRQYYGTGSADYAQTRLEWDGYGNLAKVITENAGGRERSVSYGYDRQLHQYVETIEQGGTGIAGAYRSEITWNMALGVKTSETDENGQVLRYGYDGYGRLTTVSSPYDSDSGVPAVRYRYYTEADKNWYAVTENKVRFDASDETVLTTVVQADSLGRKLYAAKNGEVRQAGLQAYGWNVSGAVEYDRKGRTVKTGQPYFVAGTSVDALLAGGIRMVNPTVKEYDGLDRITKVTLPDGACERAAYGIRGSQGYETATDAKGNRSERTYDGRGNTVRTARYGNGGNAPLTSGTFTYNVMGEMLCAFDAAGNPLTLTYDLMGRRLSMESADAGKSEYGYDRAGNLIEESTSELRSRGQVIRHEYDGLNRLIQTVYPSLPAAVYQYGPPDAAAGNLAGRLVRLTDSSGTVEYEYGKLGETVKEKRTLARHTGTAQPKTAEFAYRSNYLGQLEGIVYPDKEEVSYGYDFGGNVNSVKGTNHGVHFTYVSDIGYDQWGQRAYLRLGNGTETSYTYDENRRWLSHIQTRQGNTVLQDITYSFDKVGNVLGYANKAGSYQTKQEYQYDDLYQLTAVEGESKNYQYGMQEYTAYYSQQYRFDEQGLGNMTLKASSAASTPPRLLGDPLNYQLSYEYESGFAHRASRIGDQYYRYDRNGSVTAVQDRPFEAASERGNPQVHDLGDKTYYTEGGWGLNEPKPGAAGPGSQTKLLKEYRWDDRNRMEYSNDGRYSVRYAYGEDGERTGKWAMSNSGGESETLYFGKLWSWHYDGMVGDYTGMNSKHIFLGETRIATKAVYADGSFIQTAEQERQYYYHSDHLGSAQLVTDWRGQEYERFEYTPYGELWIEKAAAASALDVPYRFTGKERDKETGLYYYGARYLDPKDSRWLSVDPALGEYVPSPGQDVGRLPGMGGVFNTVNLHVYHYAGNNPVKYIDPDGMRFRWVYTTHKVNKDGKIISERFVNEVSKDTYSERHEAVDASQKASTAASKKINGKRHNDDCESKITERKSDNLFIVHEWSVFDTEDSEEIGSFKKDGWREIVIVKIKITTTIESDPKQKNVEVIAGSRDQERLQDDR